jgi:glycosyltransferase involved in cell wall biosynthesis
MEERAPSVSVLMTAYKGNEHFLPAVKSVLGQTYSDLELVLVLDPHPDDICEKIIAEMDDDRIKMVINEKRMGLVPSRNIALRRSRGKYLAVQDSDDLSDPRRLEKEVKFLDENKDCLLVGCPCDVINEEGEVIRKGQPLQDQEQLYYNLIFANQFPHSSVMIRKGALEKIGGYNEEFELGEDYDLFLRIRDHGRIHMLDEILVKWRDHEASTSSSRNEMMVKNVLKMIRRNISQTLGIKISADALALMIDNSIKGRSVKSVKETLTALESINENFIKNAPDRLDRDRLKEIARRKYLSLLTGQIVNGRLAVSISLIFGNIRHWPGLAVHVLRKGS